MGEDRKLIADDVGEREVVADDDLEAHVLEESEKELLPEDDSEAHVFEEGV